jgi:hypothetical protein
MQLKATNNGVEWVMARAEAHFVAHILLRILENYEHPGGGDEGSFARRWDGREALQASAYSEEDEVLWMEERAAFRSTHAQLVRTWHHPLATIAGEWITWPMPRDEIALFLLIANDHRMYLAHRYAVREYDMESSLEQIDDEDRRMAVLEIHLLAQMMEMVLPFAPV